jgi:hypothetical protein
METNNQFIQTLVSNKFSIFNVGIDKAPVNGKGKKMSKWITMTYDELVKQHNYDNNLWGMKMGLQENNRMIMSLDFDVCGKKNAIGERIGCSHTQEKLDEYLNGIDRFDGMFTSSTQGNMNVLVDYTNVPEIYALVQILNMNKTTFHELEILMGGNQVIPPSQTNCKITGVLGTARCFKNDEPFYVLTQNDKFLIKFISELLIPKIPKPKPVKNTKQPKKQNETTDVVTETNSDEQLSDYEKFDEFINTGLLDCYTTEGTHNEYIKIGYGLINVLGEEQAKTLFHNLTLRCGSQNKQNEFEDRFKALCLDRNRNKKVGRKFIIDCAKKVDAKKVKEITKKHKTQEENVLYLENDDEASDKIVEQVKEYIVYNNKRLWIKQDNLWRNDDDYINNYLLTYIMKSGIYKLNIFGEKTQFVQNFSSAESVKKVVLSKLKLNQNFDLYQKFHTTTHGRLCFLDGVLDFTRQKFYTWSEVDFEYYTCVQIQYEIGEYLKKPNWIIVGDIISRVLIPLFGKKQYKRALQFFSRAMAGHTKDKNFLTFVGNRNCGKGVISVLFNAFGDYVKALQLGNLLCERNSKESKEISRMLYWLLDYEFVRLGISQETPPPEKGLKINCDLFKRLVSGGDPLIARRNHDRTDTHFHTQVTPAIFGNNSLEYTEEDTREFDINFQSILQFKSEEDIDKMRKDGTDERVLKNFKVGDPTIKTICNTKPYHMAFMVLIFKSYSDKAVSVIRDNTDETIYKSISEQICDVYVITGDPKDTILVSETLKHLDKKKVVLAMKEFGVEKKKCFKGVNYNKWIYSGIREKIIEDYVEEEENN